MKKATLMLSTFNSGSTAWAGALHRLGMNMCPPFFSDKYEPAALVKMFDHWWHPRNTPTKARRTQFFRNWVRGQADVFAVKHPHLHLWANELKEVLEQEGYQVQFIRLVRHLPSSIDGLAKRKWVTDSRATILNAKRSIDNLLFVFPPVKVLKFNELLTDTEYQLTELASFLGLSPTPEQFTKAVNFIKRPNVVEGDKGPAAVLPKVAYTTVARIVATTSGIKLSDIPPGKDRRITIQDVRNYAKKNNIELVDPRNKG